MVGAEGAEDLRAAWGDRGQLEVTSDEEQDGDGDHYDGDDYYDDNEYDHFDGDYDGDDYDYGDDDGINYDDDVVADAYGLYIGIVRDD